MSESPQKSQQAAQGDGLNPNAQAFVPNVNAAAFVPGQPYQLLQQQQHPQALYQVPPQWVSQLPPPNAAHFPLQQQPFGGVYGVQQNQAAAGGGFPGGKVTNSRQAPPDCRSPIVDGPGVLSLKAFPAWA